MTRGGHTFHCPILLAVLMLLASVPDCAAWPNESYVETGGYVNPGVRFWIQWGTGVSTLDTNEFFAFPVPFPSDAAYVAINPLAPNLADQLSVRSFNRTHFWINRNNDAFNGDYGFTYMALGYNNETLTLNESEYGVAHPECCFNGLADGVVELNNLRWEWGRGSTDTNGDTFFCSNIGVWPKDLGKFWNIAYVQMAVTNADATAQISASGWSQAWDGCGDTIRKKGLFNRNNDINGDSPFLWQMIGSDGLDCFGRNHAPLVEWPNSTFHDGDADVNMAGIYIKTRRVDYTSDSVTRVDFETPFPNQVFHVGINVENSGQRTPLYVNGFDRYGFWVDRNGNEIDGASNLRYIALGN